MSQTPFEPTIRTAEATDLPHLAQLFYETVTQNAPQYYTAAQTQAWANLALDPAQFAQLFSAATAFLVEDRGKLLGFAGLAPDGHVTAVYVRGDRLGQGLGSRLMAVLLEQAQAQNLPRLYAEASEFSLGLFLKFGFDLYDTEVVERGGVQFHRYLVEKTTE